jgi:outer membrane receptor for ferric coprogen and ferric-rhodotorulic acid
MMVRQGIRRALGGFAMAGGALGPAALINPASAQDSQNQAATPDGESRAIPTLGAVVVQADRIEAETQAATKMSLSVRETPQAISVISREFLEKRQVLDLGSAIELTAGVGAVGKAFAGNNPRTGEDFHLRGQELDASRDVRIDGFTSGGDRNNFDLAPFERVEVVKGPSSMLYGQGSLGGFINLVRKKPSAERGFDVSVQAGSYDTYRTEVDATGALNSSESLAGQATLAFEDSGSFIDGVDSRRLVIAPGIEWSPTDATRLAASVIYQDDDFSPSLGIALRAEGNELKAPDVPRSFYFGVPSTENSKASGLHTTVSLDHEFSDRWLATLQLHHSRNRLLGIADSYGYGIDDAGNTTLYSSYVAHDNDNFAGELRIDGRFDALGREHHLLLGVEKNKQDFNFWGGGGYPYIGTGNIYDGFEDAVTIPGRSNPQNYEGRTASGNEGAYAQLLWGLTGSTRLLLGARYDRADLRNRFDADVDSSSDRSFTTRIGVTQDLGENLTAYAVFAESFNPVLSLSRAGALDPETGSGYEAGVKGEWFEGRFGASAAVFRQELDNRPIPDPDNLPGENFEISGGLQRSDGFELEASGHPLPGWTVQAAAAWLDAEYIDRNDGNFGRTPGGTIKRQISFFTEYEFQQGPLDGFAAGITALSVGDRIVLSDQNFFIEGYERFDLHLSYNGLPNTRLSLLVRNLADDTYVERPNSAYLYGHFYGSPRAVMLRVDFGAPSR